MSGSGTRSTGKNPNKIRNGSTRYGLRSNLSRLQLPLQKTRHI